MSAGLKGRLDIACYLMGCHGHVSAACVPLVARLEIICCGSGIEPSPSLCGVLLGCDDVTQRVGDV